MIEDDELLSVVRQWVQKAENDLKNAAYTLRMGKDCPTEAEGARHSADAALA
jgi:hypothetical protein